MSTLAVHVIAQGDLFREAFNAIATVVVQPTFNSAIRISVSFAVIGVVIAYIKGKDISLFGRWFLLYFAVTVIILGPKVSIEILDSSNPGAVYAVDNVPYGLAMPASIITSVGHALTSAMDDAFHMPDDAQYSKTGMLFGSRLFRLSSGFHAVDPKVHKDLDAYVKNCVMGDILINSPPKYTLSDLIHSTDIWSLVSKNPSPVRGIMYASTASAVPTFKTCREVTPLIENEVKNGTQKALTFFGIRIFGGKDPSLATSKLEQYLPAAYNYYAGVSSDARSILTKNIFMNGIRSGVLDYTSETGATAALVNLSSTLAMQRTRLSWATAGQTAAYVLPIMQTDILLLMLCLFPLIALLSMQPVIGVNVFKQYIYSLLWVESWPILFACLNLAATFYAHSKTGALASGGLTLSNSNQLALEHSDVANMAGYLMTCVPFIAIGIVRGMASSFNTAANYIGGMLHSTATGAGSEVASGNISLGNTSYGNVNANKFDTNSTYMHGMRTEQQANGALVTHTSAGTDVWNVSPATSQLGTNINASSVASESLSRQADEARSSAIQDGRSFNSSISNASSLLEHFNQSSGVQQNVGESFSNSQSATIAHHASEMYSVVQGVAERNGVSWNEAFKGMTSFSQGLSGSGGMAYGVKGVGPHAEVGLSGRLDHSRTSDESAGHDVSTHLNINNEESKKFSNDWNAIKSYSATHHGDMSHSTNATQLSQLGADLRSAENASQSFNASLTKSDRLSKLASYSEQHSSQINSNFSQGFAEYVKKHEGNRSDVILGNTTSLRVAEERETLASRYINSKDFISNLSAEYKHDSSSSDVDQLYKDGEHKVANDSKNIDAGYRQNSESIKSEAQAHGAKFSANKFNLLRDEAMGGQDAAHAQLATEKSINKDSYQDAHVKATSKIEEGSKYADKSAVNLWPGAIRPDYVKNNEEKKDG